MLIASLIAVVSFVGMATLVIGNARRIRDGRITELHPINLYDLIRPTFDVWQLALAKTLHHGRATVLATLHFLSHQAAKHFADMSAALKARRAHLKKQGSMTSSFWKEVAYEKDRLKAHFSRQSQDMIG